jgi:hypothetical protein
MKPTPPATDIPTLVEQRAHLMLFFFGPGTDAIALSVNRAYRDFNRTLHGLKAIEDASGPARKYLLERLSALPLQDQTNDQYAFDAWHEVTCIGLIDSFKVAGYAHMHIGQSQKWLNMALKYIFFFAPTQITGFQRFFPYCHIPIDNIILKSQVFENAPSFGCAWSRITDYAKYIAFQRWARTAFEGSAPLAVEFRVWASEQHAAP